MLFLINHDEPLTEWSSHGRDPRFAHGRGVIAFSFLGWAMTLAVGAVFFRRVFGL